MLFVFFIIYFCLQDDSDEDEDVKKVNLKVKKVPQFRSINELVLLRFYKVLEIEIVTTKNGDTIRLKIVDDESEDGFCYIHLPKRILGDIGPLVPKFAKISKTKKGLFFQFKGMKGLAFKFRFSTKGPV